LFWRLLAIGGVLVALGTAGALLSSPAHDAGGQPRLQLAVTDAKELRCAKGISDWEIQADVIARRLGADTIEAPSLRVAFVRRAGAPTEVAPVRIVKGDGFAAGVTSDAPIVRFQPIVRTSLPCDTSSARLVAQAKVAGQSLDATDDFLSDGVAMASPVVFGVVLISGLGLLALAVRR
jgi:hypothetical protein